MSKVVWKVVSEWDLGLEYKVFASEDTAKDFARKALEASGIEETYEECWADGMVGLTALELIDE